ncbi:hypothetical protein CV102_22875 [Natronococcus pandeyae]|uniref:Uncharacterized protein n=1 Tax=Natronococcus pandeyae TaxID=2055836 RepID=A0A8J8TN54_9EURY|nr:hypothetical protein CV102_22875 [Natronococcus pandeyae]
MSPENTPNQALTDRVVTYISQINDMYDRLMSRVRSYTPYIVRTIEVVLAIVLLAVLSHWIYWVYIQGV